MTDLLSIENLSVEFRVQGGSVRAVDGVSFRVRPASTVAIVGESGSGKSTIAQAIMGILPETGRITGGSILFHDPEGSDEVDIAALAPAGRALQQIRGGRISIIFQEPMTSLSPLHTVGDQVSEAMRLHRDVSRREARVAVCEMLRVVGFPDPQRGFHTYPFELSGGLRQRAMIAMALVCRPALLIADEPTTALDVTIQAQILKLLADLQRELGMAVLIITHDLGVVANIADEAIVMYDGQVMEVGAVDDIFRAPEHPYLRSLLRAVPRFGMAEGERLRPVREITPTTGHLLAPRERATDTVSQKAPPLIAVRGIVKDFKGRSGGLFGEDVTMRVVDDVSFEVRRGETLGLVGESGCGKTTLCKIIMRALDPDAGEIVFDDDGVPVELTALEGRKLVTYRRRYQYVFQDPFSALNPRMTVLDIVSEPLVIHAIGDRAYRIEMVKELMEAVGLDPRFLNRYPHSFSGGQRQRISIARALALKPELLVCDEPVSSLDVSVQAQIRNLMKDLQDALGLTYLFVSHNLAVVDYVADRIAVMCRGRLVEIAPRDVLFGDPVHPYTRALLSAVPFPDPGRRLDLTALMEGRASNPEAWPAPFTLAPDSRLALMQISAGHYVRMSQDQNMFRRAM